MAYDIDTTRTTDGPMRGERALLLRLTEIASQLPVDQHGPVDEIARLTRQLLNETTGRTTRLVVHDERPLDELPGPARQQLRRDAALEAATTDGHYQPPNWQRPAHDWRMGARQRIQPATLETLQEHGLPWDLQRCDHATQESWRPGMRRPISSAVTATGHAAVELWHLRELLDRDLPADDLVQRLRTAIRAAQPPDPLAGPAPSAWDDVDDLADIPF